ncbi:PhnD/SsuA/transferrin family substrate-binding protein [Pararhizobium sp. PWRC1-1]|uniref:substrate-binding domain-containing protein n=1 Tax=Pararhizobium sp. PWRC1-1 TaxID=2804566 RepID=UPI003CED3A9E
MQEKELRPDCPSAGATVLGRRSFLGGALSLISSPAIGAALESRSDKSVLRFGLTPVFLSNDIDVLDELRNYLTKATGHEVQLVTQRTYQEVTALLVAGNLEAAWICGYPYQKFHDDLALLATPLWRGRPLYQSYFIVGSQSRAKTLDDCKGNVHAFSDPDSNSGYLVTKAYLSERHTSEDSFFRKTFFTYGHRNVIRAVASGLADSGSVDGYVWEVMRNLEPGLVDQTRVLIRSTWHGFPPVAAPARLQNTEVFNTLQSAFLNMASDPVGRSVLARLELDGFVDAPQSTFDSIAANMAHVRSLG